jgi:competence protein ComFA
VTPWARSPFLSDTHVLLPRRYHGYPLPVPQICTVRRLQRRLADKRPIPPLLKMVADSFAEERQVFVFVPRVNDVGRVLPYLRGYFPAYADEMEGVHASDPYREQKVRLFRERRYRLLVTTTILERGVTIPRSDVVVLGADAPVFDEASLVQIAGRVGRSADAPGGTVLFLQEYRAHAAYDAVRQIRRMNSLAGQMGQEAGNVR